MPIYNGTAQDITGGAHLVGAKGLSEMFQTGIIPADGNGVLATTYMNQFGGYNLANLFNWMP